MLNNLCFHSSKLFTLAVNKRYSAIFQPGYQEDSEKGEKIRVVFFFPETFAVDFFRKFT